MVSAENPVLVKISADLTGYMIIGGITMAFPPIFLVFKKSLKKKIAYFDFMDDEEVNEVLNGLKINNFSQKRIRGMK